MAKKKFTAIHIPVTVDTKALEKLEKVLKAVNTDAKNLKDNFNKAFNPQQTNNKMKSSEQATRSYARSINDLSSSIKDNTTASGNQGKSMNDISNIINRSINPMRQMQSHFGGLTNRIENLLPAAIGLHFGFTNIVHSAFEANQETLDWSKSMAQLSTSAGGTSDAIRQQIQIFGDSAGSLETVKAAMLSLNEQGIARTTKGFGDLTAFITNMSLATGIGMETFSSFSGIMIRNWGMSISATGKMTSSMVAMQKAFNSTSNEINEAMKLVGDSMEKMAMFFEDGEKSAMALTKGIGMTVGVLNKLGVSAKTSSEFMGKLLDPEQMGENIVLMGKLGISYQQYMDMLSNGNAKETIFDTILQKLPQVAQQIQSIQNPLARMNFAKSMGIPLEIAQKMAKATTGQISKLMQDYKKAAIADKAAQEKQKQMAAESQKFNDTLHLMKRDALQPMMEWVNKNMGIFWKTAGIVFDLFKKYTTGLTHVFDAIKTSFTPAFQVLSGGGGFPDFLVKLTDGFINMAVIGFNKFWDLATTIGPKIAVNMAEAWGKMMMAHPIITSLITIATVMKIYSGVVGGVRDFVNAFRKERGATPMNPMFVSDISNGFSGGGKAGKLGKAIDFLMNIRGLGKVAEIGKSVAGGTGKFLTSTGGKVAIGGVAGVFGAYKAADSVTKQGAADLYQDRRERTKEHIGLNSKFETNKGLYIKDASALAKMNMDRKFSHEDNINGEQKRIGFEAGMLDAITFGLFDKKKTAQLAYDYNGMKGTEEKKIYDARIKREADERVKTYIKEMAEKRKLQDKEDKLNILSFEKRIMSGKKLNAEELKNYQDLSKKRIQAIGNESENYGQIMKSQNNWFYSWLGKMGMGLGMFEGIYEATTKIGLEFRYIPEQFKDMMNQMSLDMQGAFVEIKQLLHVGSKKDDIKKNFAFDLRDIDVDLDNKYAKSQLSVKRDHYAKMANGDATLLKELEDMYQSRLKVAKSFDKGRAELEDAKTKDKKTKEEERRVALMEETNRLLKENNGHAKGTGANIKKLADKDDRQKQQGDWIGAFLGYSTALKVGVGGR